MGKIEDYMKEAFSKAGKKVVEFEDLREVRKRRGRKKENKKTVESEKENIIISNDEGFEIVGAIFPKYVEFDEIAKKYGWHSEQKGNLEEWTTFDFFRYTYRLYVQKYNRQWPLKLGGGSLELKKIFSILEDKFGSVNNLLMKDYIIFFFEKHVDGFVRRRGEFYFSHMSRPDVLKSFYNSYNYKANLRTYFDKRIREDDDTISNQAIERAFLLSESNLLCKYGFVVALNWMIFRKKMGKREAMRRVYASCQKVKDKKMFDLVVSATERYSPYPSWFIFKKPRLLMDRVAPDCEVKVDFTESEKNLLDFLKPRGYNTSNG